MYTFRFFYSHKFQLVVLETIDIAQKQKRKTCVEVYFIARIYNHNRQKQPPRQFSKISVLFFQEHLFLDFSRRPYVFTEKILIFQEDIFFRRTDRTFQETSFLLVKQIVIFQETSFLLVEQITIFQKGIFFRRTDTVFSRKLCLFIEQIPIFQEYFFGYRTDTDFAGAPRVPRSATTHAPMSAKVIVIFWHLKLKKTLHAHSYKCFFFVQKNNSFQRF